MHARTLTIGGWCVRFHVYISISARLSTEFDASASTPTRYAWPASTSSSVNSSASTSPSQCVSLSPAPKGTRVSLGPSAPSISELQAHIQKLQAALDKATAAADSSGHVESTELAQLRAQVQQYEIQLTEQEAVLVSLRELQSLSTSASTRASVSATASWDAEREALQRDLVAARNESASCRAQMEEQSANHATQITASQQQAVAPWRQKCQVCVLWPRSLVEIASYLCLRVCMCVCMTIIMLVRMNWNERMND
jgi:hypothetical protein